MDEEILKKSADLIAKELGGITLPDLEKLEEPALTDDELMARAVDIELLFKKHFEKVFPLMILKQYVDIGNYAQTPEQLVFGRGALHGLYIIHEWVKDQVALAQSRFQEKENESETK